MRNAGWLNIENEDLVILVLSCDSFSRIFSVVFVSGTCTDEKYEFPRTGTCAEMVALTKPNTDLDELIKSRPSCQSAGIPAQIKYTEISR